MPGLVRNLGSAGSPSTEIGMIDENLKFLPGGATGKIVMVGPAVMEGYEGDPDATAKVFINGWYRMGDVGYLDEDGYLFIVGRVKEVINRGGQKVSPVEVEQALLANPAVNEAVVVAFL